MIRGTWTVLGWDGDAKRYDLGLAAEDGGFTTRVGRAHLERLLREAETATRRPGPVVSAVDFYATDYPLAVAMVYAHIGDISSMDGTKMGTVLAIKAEGKAGAVLPPNVLASGASESALRRHARAAFAALETLLEREGRVEGDSARATRRGERYGEPGH